MGAECKRVGLGGTYGQLNTRYVTQGVVRFINGQYAVGHAWGFMLGYALSVPAERIVSAIDQRLQQTYGASAALAASTSHWHALAIHDGRLKQDSGAAISVRHIIVDMVPAANQMQVCD